MQEAVPHDRHLLAEFLGTVNVVDAFFDDLREVVGDRSFGKLFEMSLSRGDDFQGVLTTAKINISHTCRNRYPPLPSYLQRI